MSSSQKTVVVDKAGRTDFSDTRYQAFIERSPSAKNRRAYLRVTREFFRFCGGRQAQDITSAVVQNWRDHLHARRQKTATNPQKLAIVYALVEFLSEEGSVTQNLATPHQTEDNSSKKASAGNEPMRIIIALRHRIAYSIGGTLFRCQKRLCATPACT